MRKKECLEVFKRYANLSSRASRREFWVFNLVNIAIISFFIAVINMTGTDQLSLTVAIVGLFLFMIIIAIPAVAILIGRIHDTGRSGWWWIVIFIPIIGWLILFTLTIMSSQKSDNKYGKYNSTAKWSIAIQIVIIIAIIGIVSSWGYLKSEHTTSEYYSFSVSDGSEKEDNISAENSYELEINPEDSMVIEQKVGNNTNYTIKGNLKVTNNLGCIEIDDVKDTYTPADIFPAVVDCIDNDKGQDAAELFLIASLYGSFDKSRVNDITAHQAVSALIAKHIEFIDSERKKTFVEYLMPIVDNDETAVSDFCQKIKQVKHPKYFPGYMIYHGMEAFKDDFNPREQLITNFNASDTWDEIVYGEGAGCLRGE